MVAPAGFVILGRGAATGTRRRRPVEDQMEVVHDHVLPPKSGYALELGQGQHLRITDLEGKQVVDVAVFNADNHGEKLSTSNSRTRYVPEPGAEYVPRDRLTEGDTLMSTLCRPMMTIVRDTPEPKGVHDVHNRMCNRFLFESHGVGPRDGCHEIISRAVEPYGIGPEDIPDTMDVFMNYHHDCERGRWVIGEPVSKPGDYIELRAEINCLVGLSNCPEDVLTDCNAKHCTPMKVEVFGP
ncbi:MAG: DUF1989 domain-containing protein [Solirubrobacterales bacterium]|nr:DUF1989 domain-containing protein [Solirubrobacterales bacterium]